MTFRKSYDDAALAAAIATSHSWRGVLRSLGLHATSAGAMRTARRHADRLALDYSHFTGQRTWSDAALIRAVAESRSWTQVATALGVAGGSSYPVLKGHALRLGLDTSHIGAPPARSKRSCDPVPDPAYLRRAGSLLAASWFALCGYDVSWPLEPCRYDLLVHVPEKTERVQVKTTTQPSGSTVRLAPGDKSQIYDPDDIDSFFIIGSDLSCYWIPIEVVAGFRGITLAAYTEYRIAKLPLLAACHRREYRRQCDQAV
jgi:hypothetical protein